jgi:spore maturation protein SpmA
MVSVIVGVLMIILAVILWVGHISLPHAVAIMIGLIGLLVLLFGVVPVAYTRFGPPRA